MQNEEDEKGNCAIICGWYWERGDNFGAIFLPKRNRTLAQGDEVSSTQEDKEYKWNSPQYN